jgi:hypothetical protein
VRRAGFRGKDTPPSGVVPVSPNIHQFDPAMRPDSEFAAGTLHHLVEGNAGRMLDVRRTPIRVAGLLPEIGSWICEVTAFEDAGARWTLPLETVDRFQFERAAARATAEGVETFEEQIRRFDIPLVIEPEADRARATRAALERRRRDAAAWLAAYAPALGQEAPIDHDSRRAPDAALTAFERFMDERGLLEMDDALARAFVTNPASGEIVKGHLMVMAEMGMAPFRGRVVRDPGTFDGPWRRGRRADHILWRAAFVPSMLEAIGHVTLELHRGVSSESPLDPAHTGALESWSFSRNVAESVAGPVGVRPHRSIETRSIPCERAWMTYLETRAMNRQFLEAEAVLFTSATAPVPGT